MPSNKSNDDTTFKLFEHLCNSPYDGTSSLIIQVMNTNSVLMNRINNIKQVTKWKRHKLSSLKNRKSKP